MNMGLNIPSGTLKIPERAARHKTLDASIKDPLDKVMKLEMGFIS